MLRNILFPKLQPSMSTASEIKYVKNVFFDSIRNRTRTIYNRSTWNFSDICKTNLSNDVCSIFLIRLNLIELQGIFYDFFTTIFFSFKMLQFFQKSIFSKTATYFLRYFHIENDEIGFPFKIENGTCAVSRRAIWKKKNNFFQAAITSWFFNILV